MRTLFALLMLATLVMAQESAHRKGVQNRGDQAMGFSHTMTTHHFSLLTIGGSIQVEADDPNDESSRTAVQQHLQHIAQAFSAGDFDLPMFIHAKHPPGVSTMKRLRKQIEYKEAATVNGAQVRITATDPRAIAAIHDFLRFQIEDHHTADSTAVQAR